MLPIRSLELHLVQVLRQTGFPSQHVLVELRTDHLTGWGEMSDLGHLPLYQFDLGLLASTLGGMLTGVDAEDRGRIEAMLLEAFPDEGHMYSRSGLVRQGIDLAVIDLVGRHHGLPASALVGGRRRDRLEVCYPIFRLGEGESVDTHLDVVATRAAEGFTLFRLYTGGHLPTEIAFLSAFRERFPGLRIKSFDFSNRLGWRAALAWTEALAAVVEPEVVESPTPRDDFDGMAAFARRGRWPLSEHAVSAGHAWRLVRFGSVDVLNVSPYVLGGISPAVRVADFASAAGVGVLIGTTQELSLGTAAAAIVGSVAPRLDHPCDNVGPRLYRDDIAVEPIAYRDGHLIVPDGPGLGIEVDPERVRALGEGVRLGVGLSPRELMARRVAGPPPP